MPRCIYFSFLLLILPFQTFSQWSFHSFELQFFLHKTFIYAINFPWVFRTENAFTMTPDVASLFFFIISTIYRRSFHYMRTPVSCSTCLNAGELNDFLVCHLMADTKWLSKQKTHWIVVFQIVSVVYIFLHSMLNINLRLNWIDECSKREYFFFFCLSSLVEYLINLAMTQCLNGK